MTDLILLADCRDLMRHAAKGRVPSFTVILARLDAALAASHPASPTAPPGPPSPWPDEDAWCAQRGHSWSPGGGVCVRCKAPPPGPADDTLAVYAVLPSPERAAVHAVLIDHQHTPDPARSLAENVRAALDYMPDCNVPHDIDCLGPPPAAEGAAPGTVTCPFCLGTKGEWENGPGHTTYWRACPTCHDKGTVLAPTPPARAPADPAEEGAMEWLGSADAACFGARAPGEGAGLEPIDKPCGHAEPLSMAQLHGVCIFCWRDRCGAERRARLATPPPAAYAAGFRAAVEVARESARIGHEPNAIVCRLLDAARACHGPQPTDHDNQLFYVQDCRNFVGNAVVWWCPDGHGYTTNIAEAGKFPASFRPRRGVDRMWPCEYVDQHWVRKPYVDMQYLDNEMAVKKKDAEPVAVDQAALDRSCMKEVAAVLSNAGPAECGKSDGRGFMCMRNHGHKGRCSRYGEKR